MNATSSRRHFVMALSGAALLPSTGPAHAAEDYPTRPIRWIIPFPPGGATDTSARIVGAELSKDLGKPVVIENRPGGNTLVATRALLSSPPDGYTIMSAASDVLSINPHLYEVPYKTEKDFAFISALMSSPYVLVARADFPAVNLRELIGRIKTENVKLNYATFGAGSFAHVAMEMFLNRIGSRMTMVPYQGAAASVAAILGGQVDMMMTDLPSSLSHIRSGKLRALGWSGNGMKSVLPEVPAIAEAGVPGFFIDPFVGVIAPAGTPVAIVERLDAAIRKVLAHEGTQKQFEERGMVQIYRPPAAFRELALRTSVEMRGLIEVSKISVK